ncbi:MAG: 3-deoxy-8-phosphooctulonate synthase [Nitrospirota bacterium]|nr:3-deoxy-8-phosphooctulonate synthase [Nitrospirota bacterium]
MTHTVSVSGIQIGGDSPLALIAGPCVIEGEAATLRAAERLKKITSDLGTPLIFKSSYDKANRSSVRAYRGPGLKEGLRILRKVKDELGLPLLSDVHAPDEITPAAEVLDCLQIPAFLCRQTDFVLAVARTGRVVNVKKGQFLAPWDMKNVIDKVEEAGNRNILLTERGVSFGYNNLVADMRSVPIMQGLGYPVVFDGTHSVQMPGGQGHCSGGDRRFVPHLTRAAVAAGCDAIFLEVHEDPDNAPCDGPNMLRMDNLAGLLREVQAIYRIVRGKT